MIGFSVGGEPATGLYSIAGFCWNEQIKQSFD